MEERIKKKKKKMEGVKRAGHVLAIVTVVLGVSVKVAMGAQQQHVVGGSQGWDESTDFNSWASSQIFNVGDSLVFKYSQGLHSVVELADESAYKSCDTSTAANSMSSGNDVVKLTKPGTRYFACGTSGHCGQGMKLKVTVSAAGGSPSSSTPASSSSPASTSSSPTTTTKSASSRASSPISLLAAALTATIALYYSSLW